MSNSNKTYFAVMALHYTHKVGINDKETIATIELKWADGMVGAIPVFNNRKAAEKYAGGNFKIYELKGYKGELNED